MTNDEYILQELKKGRTISRRTIYLEIGYAIKGKSIKFTNSLGNKGRYHVYRLVQPEQRELF